MTNREKYITKRNEYDLMMTIAENIQGIGTFCPIKAIGGKRPPCKHDTQSFLMMRDCKTCVQKFLNEEAKP
mgnify:CR=1 FL=1